MIEVIKGDMFRKAPSSAILVHACNGQGRWSSGIANKFATVHPMAYTKCRLFCEKNGKDRSIVGRGMIFKDEFEISTRIGCIFTSLWYGKHVDSPAQILQATKLALRELLSKVEDGDTLCSPKFNSGLFRVPWEDTEQVLREELEFADKDLRWIVYEL